MENTKRDEQAGTMVWRRGPKILLLRSVKKKKHTDLTVQYFLRSDHSSSYSTLLRRLAKGSIVMKAAVKKKKKKITLARKGIGKNTWGRYRVIYDVARRVLL